ncbi:MotA/TolQ/ExbB proton channel family protein [Desulfonatronovibrio magnus]|uniref:MotA/TolQ/ExbB proton channel family protein n=1 Tax=Desulfonatronovibrio magnus TaxID=698827 RepID=UPI0005EBE02B|nr:MotA/TolQ/ExbB proton channel family protein [Desulfonatronovibrio magnus]
MVEPVLELRRFFDAGGPVLWLIFGVATVLWSLIIERYWYHMRIFPREFAELCSRWESQPESDVKTVDMLLRRDVSRIRQRLDAHLDMIRTLIAVCPLLGLLGTVTGMIHVFETISFLGTGNPRAMAAGVSMATIPTMAGLVVALSGFVFSIRLQRGGRQKGSKLRDELLRKLKECPVHSLKEAE